jgi:hypothetical protein
MNHVSGCNVPKGRGKCSLKRGPAASHEFESGARFGGSPAFQPIASWDANKFIQIILIYILCIVLYLIQNWRIVLAADRIEPQLSERRTPSTFDEEITRHSLATRPRG